MRQTSTQHKRFLESYPEIARDYEQLGTATQESGPLQQSAGFVCSSSNR
jgi:hypothetical protein